MLRGALLLLTLMASALPASQEGLVEDLLREYPDRFGAFLEDPEGFRLQLLYGKILEGEGQQPTRLERHGYRVDAEYFYPASTVKLAASLASLHLLEQLRSDQDLECDLDTPLRVHPLFPDEQLEELDPSNTETGKITIGHATRKICLVSDNKAYNWLYELVGHRELNEFLAEAGLVRTHLFHRLSEFRSVEDQRHTPRVELLGEDSRALHVMPERRSDLLRENRGMPGLSAGEAHMRAGQLIDEPLSFRHKNYMPLRDLQDMLVMVCRPDIDLGMPGFQLEDRDREFLMQALGQLPRESDNPVYPRERYSDDWVKFFLEGARRVRPAVRIYNKVGRAYGFSIENAYVVDEDSGQSFFLAAVVYTNPNAILNDGVYAYADLADPLFIDLGEVFARHAFGEKD